jgi:hypothetical protein
MPALMAVNHAGNSSAQAKTQVAASPIKACPHSSTPQSRISLRAGETALPGGIEQSQTFTGTMTK